MDDQNTVTIKVILDTEEAEAAIERLHEKLSDLARALEKANSRELALDGIDIWLKTVDMAVDSQKLFSTAAAEAKRDMRPEQSK